MQVKDIVRALEKFAPLPLQDGYDNSGLQIGLTTAEVSGALLCLDVTEDVIEEAASEGCNLIVAHHPLLFKGCKQITEQNYVSRCVMSAIKHGIAIYAAHTSLDNAYRGVTYRMASLLGLQRLQPLIPSPLQGGAGSGLIGEFPEAMATEAFLSLIKTTFKAACLRHNAYEGATVKRVALCGGAGAFLIPDALEAGADVFYTGEIKYHDFFGLEKQMLLVDTGHYESEQYTVGLLEDILHKAYPELPLVKTRLNTNPIKYM